MESYIVYCGRVAICLTLFCAAYMLTMRRLTHYRFNRILLLATTLLSFLLPLCRITVYRTSAVAMPYTAARTVLQPAAATHAGTGVTLLGAAAVVYIIGAMVRFAWLATAMVRLRALVRRSRKYPLDNGATLVLTDERISPSGWRHYVIMNGDDAAEDRQAILAHELHHIRAHHSLDIMFLNVCTAMQWFNPSIWIIGRELRAIHEYEADEAVLRSGADARRYQLLLIKRSAGHARYSLASTLDHSNLKNRITMMLSSKSSRRTMWRSLYVVPLTLAAVAVFARTEVIASQPDGKDTKNNTGMIIYSSYSSDSLSRGNAMNTISSTTYNYERGERLGDWIAGNDIPDGTVINVATDNGAEAYTGDMADLRIGSMSVSTSTSIVDGKADCSTTITITPEDR